MHDNFERSNARVRVYEGGNVDDKRDPGGRTSRGVTQRTYNAYRTRKGLKARDVYLATEAEVGDIYYNEYFKRAGCDDYPAGVDFVVYDGAVNSGVGQSVKWLQRSLPNYSGKIDGIPGTLLLEAVRQTNDYDALCERVLQARLGTLKGLKVYPTYKRGWNARIANVLKISQAWASGSVGPNPVNVVALGGHQKAEVNPETVTKPLLSTAVTNITASATTIGAVAADAGTNFAPFRDVFGWAPYVLGGIGVTAAVAALIVKYGHSDALAVLRSEKVAEIDTAADEHATEVEIEEEKAPDDNGDKPEGVETAAAPTVDPAPVPEPAETGTKTLDTGAGSFTIQGTEAAPEPEAAPPTATEAPVGPMAAPLVEPAPAPAPAPVPATAAEPEVAAPMAAAAAPISASREA